VSGGKLKACNHVKARHILCEKQGKLFEGTDNSLFRCDS